jgi:CRP-like cAMP-binding protein
MNSFIKFLDELSLLDAKAAADLSTVISTKNFEKGAFILKNGKVAQHLYFLDKGLVKLFFNKGDKEFIMRFFDKNSMFTGLDSYVTQHSSDYSIIALESTAVFYISYTDMELLCKKHHCIETAFRKFISIASLNMMKRISEMLEENATERYNNFVKANTQLLQRISLYDLACYLGITQVSVSRIRAKK